MKKGIRIAICDDDSNIIEKIKYVIDSINFECNILIEYDTYYNAEAMIDYCSDVYSAYDAYILDIQLIEMSGLDFALKMRKQNNYSQIVFLTSYSEYVYNSFSVQPFEYLLKPVNDLRIKEVILRLSNYISEKKILFQFSSKKEKYNIPCKEISYIEKKARKAYIYLRNGECIETNMSSEIIREQLNTFMFVAVRKGCFVNMDAIVNIINDTITLTGGTKLLISRKYLRITKEKHLNYFDKIYF